MVRKVDFKRRNDGSSNILQTPSITTLDNEEAEIKVAQEVPFVTGQYTNTGTTNQGVVNPADPRLLDR